MKSVYQIKIVLFLLLLPVYVWAQDKSDDKEESKNELSVFAGAASNSRTAFAIGLDYQHKFNKIVGLGALIDYTVPDIGSLLIGPAVFLHAWHFEITLAPCAEFIGEDVTGVFRAGLAYEVELSKFSLSPSVYFDTERDGEETFVYGLSFGFDL